MGARGLVNYRNIFQQLKITGNEHTYGEDVIHYCSVVDRWSDILILRVMVSLFDSSTGGSLYNVVTAY